jgi:hypothetical protein
MQFAAALAATIDRHSAESLDTTCFIPYPKKVVADGFAVEQMEQRRDPGQYCNFP